METELNKNEKLSTEQETPPIANVLLCDVLSDEHIGVIARKVALKYAYANEHSYDMYVKAIIEGMKIGMLVVGKHYQ
jgi:hypothetical protein